MDGSVGTVLLEIFMNGKYKNVLVATLVFPLFWTFVAHGDAPKGRYLISGVGTVKDRLTGLTWQQSVAASSFPWSEANTYCQGLNLAGTGWRLPALKELLTLADVKRNSPAIDSVAFRGTPSESFWSASPMPGSTTASFTVNFDDGSSVQADRSTALRVRCVR
jgi:hypothetical protein